MNIKTLLNTIHSYEIYNDGNPLIKSLHMDSREVTEGGLFFCIKGYTVDGHDYVEDAIKNGAVAIVSERKLDVDVPIIIVSDTRRVMAQFSALFYGEPSKDMNIIGVTGTNGKTTITHLLDKIMIDNQRKTGLIGTMYTKIGNKRFETKNTTPESLTLQKLFRQMKDLNVNTVTMEVSSHALQSGRVRGTDFDIAVFSNLTSDHLDFHDTVEKYKFAKSLLFSQMGNTHEGKIAILNADDPVSEEYAEVTIAEVITYGIENEADIKASNLMITAEGTSFDINIFGTKKHFNTQMVGKFSVYNILAAVASSYASGLPLDEIQKSIESIKGVSGRFETVKSNAPFTVIVDYAHTPDSLENVLKTASDLKQGKLIVVVGTGGNRDTTKRPVMADIAVRFADQAIFTSDNPRKENPVQIIEDMVKGAKSDNYTVEVDRKKAIEMAVNSANENDIILIAGKGHETYQILADKTIDFDDRLIAAEAIKHRLESV